MYRVLDLFSGIGGFSLGLERTGGFKTVAFCEIDPYCRKVLAKHWPDVPCHDDITTREFKEGEADVITGGFPCQDLSYAGKGAGLAGERSGLYRHLIRAIRLVRPKYAIVENVAALLNRGLGTVLGDLAEVGYDAEWHCIPASAVGAPHRRDRVWIVANSMRVGRWNCAEINKRSHNKERDCETHQQARNAVSVEVEYGRTFLAYPNDFQQRGSCVVWEGKTLSDPKREGLERRNRPQTLRLETSNLAKGDFSGVERQWETEPNVGRVAHGIPARVDRLRALGNAVVPQIPELIGRAILEAEAVQ